MPIQPLTLDRMPRRWAIYGPSGSGKSSLVREVEEPILVIDSDHRIVEVLAESDDPLQLFTISDKPEDHSSIERICEIIKSEAKACGAKSIWLDSLTTLITPLVQKATLDADSGRFKNRSAAFKEKAALMKILQDTLTQTGLDLFYVWHLEMGSFQGETKWNHTVPQTERERLERSLNAMLQVIEKDGRRGIQIDWTKNGVGVGKVVWDELGYWKGVMEKLEGFIHAKRERFSGPTEAQEWSVKIGAFPDKEAAKKAYDSIRNEKAPKSAREMFNLWVTHATELKESAA